ncbi:MAG: hypothetical protein RLZZ51_793, partial [Actinomycetota bacterium]
TTLAVTQAPEQAPTTPITQTTLPITTTTGG